MPIRATIPAVPAISLLSSLSLPINRRPTTLHPSPVLKKKISSHPLSSSSSLSSPFLSPPIPPLSSLSSHKSTPYNPPPLPHLHPLPVLLEKSLFTPSLLLLLLLLLPFPISTSSPFLTLPLHLFPLFSLLASPQPYYPSSLPSLPTPYPNPSPLLQTNLPPLPTNPSTHQTPILPPLSPQHPLNTYSPLSQR